MRRKKRDKSSEMEAGQDSFLDIVSNIVGILIILVMVAGVRAKSHYAGKQAPIEIPVALQDAIVDFREKANTFATLRQENNETGAEIQELQRLTASRAKERAELIATVGMLKSDYEHATEKLSAAEKEVLDVQQRIRELDLQLAETARTKEWLLQNRPQATVLENLPTPLTKTVEGNEAHFRIKAGRIVHVPLAALLDRMSADVRNRLEEAAKKGEIVGTVGPIERFTMPYRVLVQSNVRIETPRGSGMGYRFHFAESEFVPEQDVMGETLQETLNPDSEFQRLLRAYRQDLYTITFWVYPDSFNEYRTLQKHLYERGYKIAARPLNFGDPIGASSQGSKSSAQ